MNERPRSGHLGADAIYIGDRDGGRVYLVPLSKPLTEDEKRLVDATLQRIDERGRALDAAYYASLGSLAAGSRVTSQSEPVSRGE